MCTAITFKSNDFYFGRNLDVEHSYNESVVVTPRNFQIKMRCVEPLKTHYAMIGVATVIDDYPLYFDATNEKGLSMAGLNFPGNADYKPVNENSINITPFEFIPYILGKCKDLNEAREELREINLVNISFSENLPLSPLHWIIADKENAITVESVKDGLKIYENTVGVLTNNPTFDFHITNLNNYMSLHEGRSENNLVKDIELSNYSLGMGALGLPGDFSSASRFIKATFVKYNSISGETEKESVNQFFHILDSVAMPKGCVLTDNGEYEYTIYSSCCNADKGVYYYKNYNSFEIKSVNFNSHNLQDKKLLEFKIKYC
ncbi:MAG: choloylglycine hydrolase family protein [Ruminococcaceae bacterium]|nr:choloylglycine hydrolase family protein [Oscillospiraceae bacterium]